VSYRILLKIFLIFILSACQQQTSYLKLNGFTMGTSYQITLQTTEKKANRLHQQIETKLKLINQLMSTYISDSELSKFNRSTSLECQTISDETYYVIENALKVSEMTRGKFDVTLAPLISEWGFDNKQTNDLIPSETRIKELLRQTGYKNVYLGKQCIQKRHQNISINLSAIAKGFGVDQISKFLSTNGIQNYLVEIGGETASKGVNSRATPWRLAIEAPIEQKRQIQQVFTPLGLGVATSGDYRNYFEKNGKKFSHTIDPITGEPITHQLISVTVLHKQTMLADAFATAFMVMGVEDSLSFAEKHKLTIYLLIKKGDGFKTIYTESFRKHLL